MCWKLKGWKKYNFPVSLIRTWKERIQVCLYPQMAEATKFLLYMHKCVSNITEFHFSSAYKKLKQATHTKEKLHNTNINSTCNGRLTTNSFCASCHVSFQSPNLLITYDYLLCSVETSSKMILIERDQWDGIFIWPLERMNWPLSPYSSPSSLLSHCTHKGTFINTTFKLLLVKATKRGKMLSAYTPIQPYWPSKKHHISLGETPLFTFRRYIFIKEVFKDPFFLVA